MTAACKKIYLVFDKLPKKVDGGLVATYERFANEFSDDYQIEIVEVFNSGEADLENLRKLKKTTLSPINIDNRFYSAFQKLAKRDFRGFVWSIISLFVFFFFIPFAKAKTRSILSDGIVISSSPAASIFISAKTRYILEIHTSFEYFWGSNLIGRLQSSLIPKPALTLFRNKSDAQKGQTLFPSSYIYNGFDGANGRRNGSPTRPITKSALFVGRLEESKNPLMLLDATEKVLTSIPEFTLDIYGSGSLFPQLESEILERGLSDSVFLRGFCEEKSIYGKHDILWMTSHYEGFGLVAIEAMAFATPTITTHWGNAVHEVIRDGETGRISSTLDSFASSSVELLSDESRLITMRKACLAEFEARFTLDRNKARWVEIFKDVYPN